LQAITFQNIGTTQWKSGQLDGAVISFCTVLQTRLMQQQQERLEQPDNFSLNMAQSYKNLGLVLLLIQNVDETMVAFETAHGIYINIRQVMQHFINANIIRHRMLFQFYGNSGVSSSSKVKLK